MSVWNNKTAIIEMAGATGITLVPAEKRNPLYTTTYGVGEVIKGATPSMIIQMDKGLENYAHLAKQKFLKADLNQAGAGAAGGAGFAFQTFTNVVLESEIKIVLEETKLEDFIKKADIVITGKGRLDKQTAMETENAGNNMIDDRCCRAGIPVVEN